MDAKKYILKELATLITNFPNVRVRYEYDKNALVHFIEVVPNKVYHLDNKYIVWENEMTDRFIEFFPIQNICFISDDALVGIENAELTLYGEQYTQISTEKESVTFDREIIVQEKSLIDTNNHLSISDNKEIFTNFSINNNYQSTSNQYKYSLAA
ncbi:MAG: hypothetical protein LBF69_04365 [Prevotellaceae bacterium]|jgi:hypothetical protein|nr:hypothetical protein [Prevotellaceae bacterium]